MAPRRREALDELLAELEGKEQGGGTEDDTGQETSAAGTVSGGNAAAVEMPGAVKPERPGIADAGGIRDGGSGVIPMATGLPEVGGARLAQQAGRSSGRERRVEARHTLATAATIYFIDVRAQIEGCILDLSMSGCRIRSRDRFPVGIYRRVETEFKADGLPFRLAGVVQAVHDRFTVGIRFLDVSARKRDQLRQLMEEIDEMKAQGKA